MSFRAFIRCVYEYMSIERKWSRMDMLVVKLDRIHSALEIHPIQMSIAYVVTNYTTIVAHSLEIHIKTR